MNSLETALHSWNEEKKKYQMSIKTLITELSKPILCIPSPDYEARMEQLKQYLKYDYTYDEDDRFNEIYVHHIVGNANMTLMQVSNKLVSQLGGTIKFWQNKVLDMASNLNFNSDLSIWQINKAYQHYLGFSPEFTQNLRKKQSLAKHLIISLGGICKQIEKSKPTQQDLEKIDLAYQKLKKNQEKYYGFIEVVEGYSSKDTASISVKGRNLAKNDLFVFRKTKEGKINTLANYNFNYRIQKDEIMKSSKLLKDNQYQDFDSIFQKLKIQTVAHRQSNYLEASQSKFEEKEKINLEELRSEFFRMTSKEKFQVQGKKVLEDQNTFIWSSEYYFTYWGFPIKYQWDVNFTEPFRTYEKINYEIDSEEEFDQLNAEDVEGDDQLISDESSLSSASFVVEDDYESEDDKETKVQIQMKISFGNQIWQKSHKQLSQYETFCLYPEQSQPLPLEEPINDFDEALLAKIEGKGRSQIFSLIGEERKDFSKQRIQNFLRTHYSKVKNKSRQIVYVRNKSGASIKPNQVIQILSDPETSAEPYEISISCVTRQAKSPVSQQLNLRQDKQETKNSRSKRVTRSSRSRSSSKNINNETILEQVSSKQA